ncbi:hypothetical protein KSP40_PGU015533 [Platanthera guangdongensis]|uniref:Imidazole glycerol-phosphate synthase n=1 Tax=Platanthera guangdongensis TaxID=2320717 RepID=A0ABR2MTI0_9ASPA
MSLLKDMMVRCGMNEVPELTLSRFRKGLNPYIQGKSLIYGHTDLNATFNVALDIEKHNVHKNKTSSFQKRKFVLGPPPTFREIIPNRSYVLDSKDVTTRVLSPLASTSKPLEIVTDTSEDSDVDIISLDSEVDQLGERIPSHTIVPDESDDSDSEGFPSDLEDDIWDDDILICESILLPITCPTSVVSDHPSIECPLQDTISIMIESTIEPAEIVSELSEEPESEDYPIDIVDELPSEGRVILDDSVIVHPDESSLMISPLSEIYTDSDFIPGLILPALSPVYLSILDDFLRRVTGRPTKGVSLYFKFPDFLLYVSISPEWLSPSFLPTIKYSLELGSVSTVVSIFHMNFLVLEPDGKIQVNFLLSDNISSFAISTPDRFLVLWDVHATTTRIAGPDLPHVAATFDCSPLTGHSSVMSNFEWGRNDGEVADAAAIDLHLREFVDWDDRCRKLGDEISTTTPTAIVATCFARFLEQLVDDLYVDLNISWEVMFSHLKISGKNVLEVSNGLQDKMRAKKVSYKSLYACRNDENLARYKVAKNEAKQPVNGGREGRPIGAYELAKAVEELGAGEILLNCIDSDGQGQGFDIDLIKLITDAVSIPVIASSGAGAVEHFSEVFQKTSASAALAAGIFHRREVCIIL